MIKEDTKDVKVGDVLYHTVFQQKVVIDKILTEEDKKNGYHWDIEYHFIDDESKKECDSWLFVEMIKTSNNK